MLCIDGPATSRTPRALTKSINVVPGLTVNAVTIWYVSSCTQSAGTGSFEIAAKPAYGTVGFRSLSAPAPGCPAGSPALPATQADYTWTSTDPKAKADHFQLDYILGGQVAATIDINVTLTRLHITFNGAVVTSTTSVVAAGEQIGLGINLVPEKPRAVAWTIPGHPIGGYEPPAACARPAPESCIGAIVPAPSLDQAAVTVYWVSAGKFEVRATLTLENSKTLAATATFDVRAPRGGIRVSADAAKTRVTTGSFSCGNGTSVPVDPCIYFTPSLDSPFKSEQLQFVQLVTQGTDDVYWTKANVRYHEVCSATNAARTATSGLDNYYPDPDIGGTGTKIYAYDDPAFQYSIPGVPISQQVSFDAEMFLMWRVDEPGAIFVPLGSVQWRWTASAAFGGDAWKLTKFAIVSSGLRPPAYPLWRAVIQNGYSRCTKLPA
jgi:hypothetical protein